MARGKKRKNDGAIEDKSGGAAHTLRIFLASGYTIS